MAERLDNALETRIATIEASDPDRARALREDVLFPVRHRRQEILTQLAVAVQGYAALRVVEINNRELVRAVRKNGTNVWYLLAKDEGHGFVQKRNRDFRLYSIVLFVEEYLLK